MSLTSKSITGLRDKATIKVIFIKESFFCNFCYLAPLGTVLF
jgi:hypothetical protein